MVIGRYSKRRLLDIFSQKGDEGEETLIRRGLQKAVAPLFGGLKPIRTNKKFPWMNNKNPRFVICVISESSLLAWCDVSRTTGLWGAIRGGCFTGYAFASCRISWIFLYLVALIFTSLYQLRFDTVKGDIPFPSFTRLCRCVHSYLWILFYTACFEQRGNSREVLTLGKACTGGYSTFSLYSQNSRQFQKIISRQNTFLRNCSF